MISGVDHIGIAVSSIESALKLYSETLGLRLSHVETIEDQMTKTTVFTVGETKIELLESTAPDGPIAKHIASRGEGLHHIAFKVSDIEGALKSIAAKGITLVDEIPRKGIENTDIAFLHPRATGKVLIEIVQSA